jgi:hypothetical protein
MQIVEWISVSIPGFLSLFLFVSGYLFDSPEGYISIDGVQLQLSSQPKLIKLYYFTVFVSLLELLGFSYHIYPVFDQLKALPLYLTAFVWVTSFNVVGALYSLLSV